MTDQQRGNGGEFQGSVKVKLEVLERQVSRLEGSVDKHDKGEPCREWRIDMEKRVRRLEAGYWAALGVLALLQMLGFGAVISMLQAKP